MVRQLSWSYKIKDVDLIVELIGGAEGAAKKLVFEALKKKNMSWQLIRL